MQVLLDDFERRFEMMITLTKVEVFSGHLL